MGEVFTHKLELALAHTALIATGATAIDIVEHDEVYVALVEGIDRRTEDGTVGGGLAPEQAVDVAVVIAHHGIGARGQLGYHALQVGIEREVVVDQVTKENIDIGAVLGHELGQDGARSKLQLLGVAYLDVADGVESETGAHGLDSEGEVVAGAGNGGIDEGTVDQAVALHGVAGRQDGKEAAPLAHLDAITALGVGGDHTAAVGDGNTAKQRLTTVVASVAIGVYKHSALGSGLRRSLHYREHEYQ